MVSASQRANAMNCKPVGVQNTNVGEKIMAKHITEKQEQHGLGVYVAVPEFNVSRLVLQNELNFSTPSQRNEMIDLFDGAGGYDNGKGTMVAREVKGDDLKKAQQVVAEMRGMLKSMPPLKVKLRDRESEDGGTKEFLITADVATEVFDETYGKAKVKGVIVSGHRRTDGYFWYLCYLKVAGQDYQAANKLTYLVRTYKNDDWQIDCIDENVNKAKGSRAVTDTETFLFAYRACQAGKSQKYLRDVFGDGTGQKLHGAAMIAIEHRDLNLVEEVKSGKIKVGPMDKEILRKARNAFNDAKTDEEREKAKTGIIEAIAGKKDDQQKSATRDQMKKVVTATENPLIALVIQCVLDADFTKLGPLQEGVGLEKSKETYASAYQG